MTDTIKVLVLRPNGNGEVTQLPKGDLPAMQALVDGYIEPVYTDWGSDDKPQTILWCNEEAVLLGFPTNEAATALRQQLDGPSQFTNPPLLGPVIVTGGPDDEGEILPIRDQVIDLWKRHD